MRFDENDLRELGREVLGCAGAQLGHLKVGRALARDPDGA